MERLQEILLLLENSDDLSDEQIGELETELMEIFDDLLEDEERTPEIIQAMGDTADAIDGLRALAGGRIETAEAERLAEETRVAEEAERIAELESRVHGAEDEPEAPEDLDDPEDPEDIVAEDGVIPDLEDIDLDEEPEVEVTAEVDEVDEVEEEPVPVAASAPAPAPAAPATTPRSELRSRQRRAAASTPHVTTRSRIRAAGRGGTFRDRVAVEDALLERWFDLQGTGETGRRRVATFEHSFPSEHVLREGAVTDVNAMAMEVRAKAAERGGAESLTADGGLCGPVDRYSGLENVSQASRPLRSRLAQFQAKRGGIRFDPPIKMSDINSATTPTSGNAIGVVTEAQDAAETYDKSYQTVECGTEVEEKVDAVYLQLEFGRFMERTNPERKSNFTDISLASFARFNEQRLHTSMIANSTHLNAPQSLGATRDLLAGLNRAAVNYRAIHRMDPAALIEVVIPGWVGWGLLPDDQANALQSYEDQYMVTATKIEQWLRARNIVVGTWFQDDFTTAASNEGGVNSYPSSFKVLMYHPGAHVYVDQGELNLGVLVDS